MGSVSIRCVFCLTISDVPGDDPASIGSGPLTPVAKLNLPDSVPDWIKSLLASGNENQLPESFDHVNTRIIASVSDAVSAAANTASKYGYDVVSDSNALVGDIKCTGPALVDQLAQSNNGTVCIWGGETTVKLPATPGRGGRNQSLALAAAIALAGRAGLFFHAAGTDGTDGPGEDAGGMVDGDTVSRGKLANLDAERSLQEADAGTFLEATGDLIATGPTGTNVMDIAIGLKL